MDSDRDKDADNDSINSQVFEYCKKYSQNRNLSQYFTGSSINYMPQIADLGDNFDVPEITIEDTHTETLVAAEVDQGQEDTHTVTIVATEDAAKQISPASSVTSIRKLEWDNGADIGYSNCNLKLHKSFSLPSLPATDTKDKQPNNKAHKKTEDPKIWSSPDVSLISSQKAKKLSSSSSSTAQKAGEVKSCYNSSSSSTNYGPEQPSNVGGEDSSSSSSSGNILGFLKGKIGSPGAESTPKVYFNPKIIAKTIKLCITKPISIECLSKKNLNNNKEIQADIQLTQPVDRVSRSAQTSPPLRVEEAQNQSVFLINHDSDTNPDGSKCDSFEYYSNGELQRGGGDNNVDNNHRSSSEEHSEVPPLLAQLISQKNSAQADKSLTILRKLLKSKKYDPVTKKRYIKKILQRIVDCSNSSTTSSDFSEKTEPEIQQKLQENRPWFPAPRSKFTVKTFSNEYLPTSNLDSPSCSWKSDDNKTASEKFYEAQSNGGGDHVLKVAQKERQHQLCWITSEITHLTKLKRLLEDKKHTTHKTTTVYMMSDKGNSRSRGSSSGSARSYVIHTELGGSSSSNEQYLMCTEGTCPNLNMAVLQQQNHPGRSDGADFFPKKPSLVGVPKYDTFPRSQKDFSSRCLPCGMSRPSIQTAFITKKQYTFEMPLDKTKSPLTKRVETIMSKYKKLETENGGPSMCPKCQQCTPSCKCKDRKCFCPICGHSVPACICDRTDRVLKDFSAQCRNCHCNDKRTQNCEMVSKNIETDNPSSSRDSPEERPKCTPKDYNRNLQIVACTNSEYVDFCCCHKCKISQEYTGATKYHKKALTSQNEFYRNTQYKSDTDTLGSNFEMVTSEGSRSNVGDALRKYLSKADSSEAEERRGKSAPQDHSIYDYPPGGKDVQAPVKSHAKSDGYIRDGSFQQLQHSDGQKHKKRGQLIDGEVDRKISPDDYSKKTPRNIVEDKKMKPRQGGSVEDYDDDSDPKMYKKSPGNIKDRKGRTEEVEESEEDYYRKPSRKPKKIPGRSTAKDDERKLREKGRPVSISDEEIKPENGQRSRKPLDEWKLNTNQGQKNARKIKEKGSPILISDEEVKSPKEQRKKPHIESNVKVIKGQKYARKIQDKGSSMSMSDEEKDFPKGKQRQPRTESKLKTTQGLKSQKIIADSSKSKDTHQKKVLNSDVREDSKTNWRSKKRETSTKKSATSKSSPIKSSRDSSSAATAGTSLNENRASAPSQNSNSSEFMAVVRLSYTDSTNSKSPPQSGPSGGQTPGSKSSPLISYEGMKPVEEEPAIKSYDRYHIPIPKDVEMTRKRGSFKSAPGEEKTHKSVISQKDGKYPSESVSSNYPEKANKSSFGYRKMNLEPETGEASSNFPTKANKSVIGRQDRDSRQPPMGNASNNFPEKANKSIYGLPDHDPDVENSGQNFPEKSNKSVPGMKVEGIEKYNKRAGVPLKSTESYFEDVERKIQALAKKISECRCQVHVHPSSSENLKNLQEKVLNDIDSHRKNRHELYKIFSDIKDKTGGENPEMVPGKKDTVTAAKSRCPCCSVLTQTRLNKRTETSQTKKCICHDDKIQTENKTSDEGTQCICDCCHEKIQAELSSFDKSMGAQTLHCPCIDAKFQTDDLCIENCEMQTDVCFCKAKNTQTNKKPFEDKKIMAQISSDEVSQQSENSDESDKRKTKRSAVLSRKNKATLAKTVSETPDDEETSTAPASNSKSPSRDSEMNSKDEEFPDITEEDEESDVSIDSSSSSSSSTSEDTYGPSLTTLDTRHSCVCCKKRLAINEKQKYLDSLRKELSEQAYPLCRPCARQNGHFNHPLNYYNNPNHICNCVSVVQTKTLDKIKQTIKDLNDIEDCCSCTKPRSRSGKNYCDHCRCKLRQTVKSKSGIAYLLTFQEEPLNSSYFKDQSGKKKKKRSLEEIKIKIPVPRGHGLKNKKHKDKENKKKKKPEKKRKKKSHKLEHLGGPEGTEDDIEKTEKTEKKHTLQEYLNENRPNFVETAEGRRKVVNDLRGKRQDTGDANKLEFLKKNANKNKSLDGKRLFTSKEMKEINKRNYQKLPEVQRKLVDKKENKLRQASRLMADTFNRNLQESVLKGKRSFSTDATVLNL